MNIEDVIKEAKQAVFSSDTGDVIPMITLEMSHNTLILALDIFDDSQSVAAQSGLAARYGWEQCQNYQGQHLLFASCYSVAWKTRNPAVGLRPNLDPKREEVLSVSTWKPDGPVQVIDLPIIRDHKKRVVDIGPAQDTRPDDKSLLTFFLYGAHDALAGVDTNLRQAEGQITNRLAALTPQQKQQLMKKLMEEEPWIIAAMKEKGYM